MDEFFISLPSFTLLFITFSVLLNFYFIFSGISFVDHTKNLNLKLAAISGTCSAIFNLLFLGSSVAEEFHLNLIQVFCDYYSHTLSIFKLKSVNKSNAPSKFALKGIKVSKKWKKMKPTHLKMDKDTSFENDPTSYAKFHENMVESECRHGILDKANVHSPPAVSLGPSSSSSSSSSTFSNLLDSQTSLASNSHLNQYPTHSLNQQRIRVRNGNQNRFQNGQGQSQDSRQNSQTSQYRQYVQDHQNNRQIDRQNSQTSQDGQDNLGSRQDNNLDNREDNNQNDNQDHFVNQDHRNDPRQNNQNSQNNHHLGHCCHVHDNEESVHAHAHAHAHAHPSTAPTYIVTHAEDVESDLLQFALQLSSFPHSDQIKTIQIINHNANSRDTVYRNKKQMLVEAQLQEIDQKKEREREEKRMERYEKNKRIFISIMNDHMGFALFGMILFISFRVYYILLERPIDLTSCHTKGYWLFRGVESHISHAWCVLRLYFSAICAFASMICMVIPYLFPRLGLNLSHETSLWFCAVRWFFNGFVLSHTISLVGGNGMYTSLSWTLYCLFQYCVRKNYETVCWIAYGFGLDQTIEGKAMKMYVKMISIMIMLIPISSSILPFHDTVFNYFYYARSWLRAYYFLN